MTTKTMEPSEYDWSRVVFDHLHLRVADLQASRSFYATVLAPLDVPLLLDTPGMVCFANLALSADGEPSERVHIAFAAASHDVVDAFYRTALDAGYRDNGAPGPRAHGAYAAYVLDPDGNNIEATHRSAMR